MGQMRPFLLSRNACMGVPSDVNKEANEQVAIGRITNLKAGWSRRRAIRAGSRSPSSVDERLHLL